MEYCYLDELFLCLREIDKKILVKGISIDSRTTLNDEVYFAIEGKNYDGHNFIKEAVYNGACAIVCSKDLENDISDSIAVIKTANTTVALGEAAKAYIQKFKNIKKIAITGSNGKTTTKEMLTSILKIKGKTHSSIGNYNNRIGLPLSAFGLTADVKYAVFEMGTSIFGEIKILSEIVNPNIGVITNIGFAHLETFKCLEGVLKEKIDLFYSVNKNDAIIINDDDKCLRNIANKDFESSKTIKYSLEKTNVNIYVRDIKVLNNKTSFIICEGNNSIEINMCTKGIFNVSNALAAASCARALGIAFIDIKKGLENFSPLKMRMDTLVTDSGSILINDAYNANPSSTRAAMDTVLELYQDKQINLILGDMLELGENSDKLHFELGKFINSQNINSVALIGEKSLNIYNAIVNKNTFYANNEESLLSFLKTLQKDNAVFLFKASRGMELEKVYEKFYVNLQERKIN